MGAHVFLSAQFQPDIDKGLRSAAFFVGIRQEIYHAFVHQRPVAVPLEQMDIDMSLEPASDSTWSNRSVDPCFTIVIVS